MKSKWKVLITVAITTMMATMDASITNIAFPVLARIFHADVSVIMWVTVVFVLVSTSSMLMIGKIGDMVGRKRIFPGRSLHRQGYSCSFSVSAG